MSRMTVVMRQFGTLPTPPPKPTAPVDLEKMMSELSAPSVADREQMEYSMMRVMGPRYKYQQTTNHMQRTLGDVWGQHRFASTQAKDRIIRAFSDAIVKAEESFDQAFGGWIPASNEFGYTVLRENETLNRDLGEDEEMLLIGWVSGDAPALQLEVGTHKVWVDIPAGNGPIPILYFPEPMIIEPRAYIGMTDPTATLVGYYFAPAAKMFWRSREAIGGR